MPKKLNYIYVKEHFEKFGYVLLSQCYISSSTLLEYKCNNGHFHNIRWNDFARGIRCPECNYRTYGLKYRINEIKQLFINAGYCLLSKAVENINSVVEIRCFKGHVYMRPLKHWLAGNRCPYCSNKVRLKDRSLEIKKEFAKFDYVFEGFFGRKIKYICNNNHHHSILWGDWQRGHRCPICSHRSAGLKILGSNHPMWKGGVSCEPYCFNWTKELKEYIKERDNYRCQNPYCYNNCKTLTVHHIDYNKKNCHPNNLITICTSCNSRANIDRSWHTSWYKVIIQKRYGDMYHAT